MNIKKLALWLTIIMVASLTMSAILFTSSGITWADFWSFDNLVENDMRYKNNINEQKQFSIDDIKEIEVKTISSDVNIIAEKRENIEVHFTGHVASSNNPNLPIPVAENIGGALRVEIKYPSNISIGFNISNINIDIYVPEDYSKDLGISTTSGDVTMGNLSPKSFSFKTISGDLNAKEILTDSSTIESTSGKVEINSLSGELLFNSISGDLHASFKELQHDITAKTTSGEIEIKLPGDADFNLKTQTTSGDINCEFPLAIEGSLNKKSLSGKVGEGENNISISTISGDIDIVK